MTVLSRVEDVPRVRSVPHPYEQVAEHYRSLIRAGKLKPGERFPSIATVARDWGVVNATAQRVVNLLKQEGWVRAEHGRGTYVADAPPP